MSLSRGGVTTVKGATQVDRAALVRDFVELMPAVKRRIENRLPADVREELAAVTIHQCQALVLIADSSGMSMNDLARSQNVSMSSCTALADRLVRQGLAERTSEPGDRRVVRLMPTERALTFVERFRQAKLGGALEALAALDDSELETFVALIRKLAAADTAEHRRD